MVGKLVKNESGMALGLAVIVIVLIGVLGAGLLVFVRNDLEAVVEVNRGQKALEAADAGTQAAKAHLKLEADPREYDGDEAVEDSPWSYSRGGGEIALEGNQANVKIRYLEPATTETQAEDAGFAPEVLSEGETGTYFNVTSEGVSGDAKRVVESIYRTRETGTPAAWYSTGDFDWNGDAFEASNISVFSGGNVTGVRPGNLEGCDTAYGDWYGDPWNETRRPDDASTDGCPDGFPTGIGTTKNIEYDGGGLRPGIDYDSSPDSELPFVENDWAGTSETQNVGGEISYPFDPDPDSQVDLDALRAVAASGKDGSRLVTAPDVSPGSSYSIGDYPEESTDDTVYFVEFANEAGTYTGAGGLAEKGAVTYATNTPLEDARGTIVVVNGDFEIGDGREYRGLIFLRDPVDDGETLEYVSTGDVTLGGFANVEGTITMGDGTEGTVSSEVPPSLADDLGKRPGFYTLERWSWRECYTEDCD